MLFPSTHASDVRIERHDVCVSGILGVSCCCSPLDVPSPRNISVSLAAALPSIGDPCRRKLRIVRLGDVERVAAERVACILPGPPIIQTGLAPGVERVSPLPPCRKSVSSLAPRGFRAFASACGDQLQRRYSRPRAAAPPGAQGEGQRQTLSASGVPSVASCASVTGRPETTDVTKSPAEAPCRRETSGPANEALPKLSVRSWRRRRLIRECHRRPETIEAMVGSGGDARARDRLADSRGIADGERLLGPVGRGTGQKDRLITLNLGDVGARRKCRADDRIPDGAESEVGLKFVIVLLFGFRSSAPTDWFCSDQ